MIPETHIEKQWTCPQCGRQFKRQGQVHSCKIYPIEQHFKGKPKGQLLFDILKEKIEKEIGSFKVESLECCIHFVHNATFLAVKIFKDKIQVDFSLNQKIESTRFQKFIQYSAHRYLYYLEIHSENDIDHELLVWIKATYHPLS